MLAAPTEGATIQLEDGRILSGELGETAGVAEDPTAPGPTAGQIRTTPILVVEDGLRRTYLHKTAVREVIDEGRESLVRILVRQNVAKRGAPLGVIGAAASVTPFDPYGRRIIDLPTSRGAISVVQGITEVNPVYTRVQGLRAEPRSYVWDMRLATSSLPRDALRRVLAGATGKNNLDERMQIVRLFLQAERYQDAARELEAIGRDFADSSDVDAADLEENLRRLRELASRRLLEEIQLRQQSGQHGLARMLLERFPEEGVAGETLQRIRELLDEDDAQRAQQADSLDRLRETAASLQEPASRAVAERIVAEIEARLGPASADRLTAFNQLSTGNALTADELTGIAISGWLVGSNNAEPSLASALNLVALRDRVRGYLIEPDAPRRETALLAVRESPVATVERVAELLARMEPPLPLELPAEGEAILPPGCHRLAVPVGDRVVESLLQLPPEYDPLRRYPVIVTLGDLGAAPVSQLNYWAGPPRGDLGRIGQAMRRGYIVLSIDWSQVGQLRYDYTPAEHAAVLKTLRDAMRRVSIDSDRVFLTGHGPGGDLAWDLALAHPDQWAGVLLYLAKADRYCGWYWENGEHVPWRCVFGELDGDKLEKNAREYDRYLRPAFDATVVEYRGRGYDPLSDDIQRAFDWMNRRRRGPAPEEFECNTMRPWDNYFWWIEANELPEQSMVLPAQWPRRGARAASIRGRKYAGNELGVFTAAKKISVWLSPDLIDFSQPLEIKHNGRRILPRGTIVVPDLEVLLEDARTRAERRRPYWAKVES